MKSRCYTPSDSSYRWYGARGITVCPRWRLSFVVFLTDMGPRPPDHSIERRDSDGHYTPDNCYWLPREQQPKNMRSCKLIEYNGRKWTTAELGVALGYSKNFVSNRLYRGWTIEEILAKPKCSPHGRHKSA